VLHRRMTANRRRLGSAAVPANGPFRRILRVASRSGEGLLTDPIAGAQPADRDASSFRSASGDPFLM